MKTIGDNLFQQKSYVHMDWLSPLFISKMMSAYIVQCSIKLDLNWT